MSTQASITLKHENGNANFLKVMLNQAEKFYEEKRLEDAKKIYCKVLQMDPDQADLLHMIGLIDDELGDFQSAEKYFKKAVRSDPTRHNFIVNIGQFYINHNKFDVALKFLLKFLPYNRSTPEIYTLIGDIYKEKEIFYEAIKYYQKSINLNPEANLVYNKLGNCFLLTKTYEKAVKCYQQLLSINPQDVTANHNLGKVYIKFGLIDAAIKHFKIALSEDPKYTRVLIDLGTAYLRKRDLKQTSKIFNQALAIEPDNYLINYYIGTDLKEHGKTHESIAWFEKSLKENPDFQPALIQKLLPFQIIYANQAEIEFFREKFQKGLDRLIDDFDSTKQENVKKHYRGVKSWTNFYLAYQGKNDLTLQKKYGDYLSAIMKATYPALYKEGFLADSKQADKIRIGYISEYMFAHTVGKLFIGWVENADRSKFEIYCYHTNNFADDMTERFKKASDRYHHIVKPLDCIADQIIADKIDILVFFDIGMNAQTKLLAALRLAPIQCVTWGHPVTTGLPTIDYFLSSELMEPADGQQHYTEKLHTLPNLSISYQGPQLPRNPKKRGFFNLRDNDFVYLSTQSLFKYLPEDDFIFAQIAALVPGSKFVFIEHESDNATRIFKQRLKREFQKHGLDSEEFCIFQPRLTYDDFLSLNIAADVLLDPPAWSGGMTSLEGVSCELTTVTLPGKYMRSRHTYAILKYMGLDKTIATNKDDYIAIAVRLGKDKKFFSSCKEAMRKKVHRIYEDKTAIEGLESFFKSLIPTS